MVRPIPEGFHTITPHIIVGDAPAAIEFYKKAFGAEVMMSIPTPDGKSVAHAELRIGDSILMLAGEFPEYGCVGPKTIGGTPVTIHLYVRDVDAAFKRATEAGATAAMPIENMFWGDRYGKLVDPFGHTWSIATHVEDVAPGECAKRAAASFGESGCCDHP